MAASPLICPVCGKAYGHHTARCNYRERLVNSRRDWYDDPKREHPVWIILGVLALLALFFLLWWV